MTNDPCAQASSPITLAPPKGLERGGQAGGDPSDPVLHSRKSHKERHIVVSEMEGAKRAIQEWIGGAVHRWVQQVQVDTSLLNLERTVAVDMAVMARHALALMLATACQAAMQRDLEKRGLSMADIRVRSDADGYATLHTTFGRITFPIFAYRDLTTPLGATTRYPSLDVLPFHRACRSSPLCLEWEVRLGAEHPFRKAEEMFHFFTRGASTVEDTTICRHMLLLGSMVEPQWLYRTPEDIRHILQNRATRDLKTGRPLLYVSSDAHALRRYAGLTWQMEWKMVNGIRMWCEDAETGRIIHLGGEFTWGDCHVVGERFSALLRQGILPNNDEAWTHLNPQVVFISDGADWFKDHILPYMQGAEIILDPYHLIEWFALFTALVFGSGSKRSRQLHAAVQCALFGKKSKPTSEPKPRRGHIKKPRSKVPHTHGREWLFPGRPRTNSSTATCDALLKLIAELSFRKKKHQEALEKLRERLVKNQDRMDYVVHLARGYQIGSGAMESMHRNGSQRRLKVPGARWLEDSSAAVLTFRMLELSGRWDEFWNQADIINRMTRCLLPIPSAQTPLSATQTSA